MSLAGRYKCVAAAVHLYRRYVCARKEIYHYVQYQYQYRKQNVNMSSRFTKSTNSVLQCFFYFRNLGSGSPFVSTVVCSLSTAVA